MCCRLFVVLNRFDGNIFLKYMCLFLQAQNVRPSEIHRRLVAVYGEHVMNAASVRKWCTMFRNGRRDVHDAERSGRPSVITDALKQRWASSFEGIDISQLAKCTNNVRMCLVQLCTKLSPNICNTAKFVHVGPGDFLVGGGNKQTGVTVRQVPQCPRWLCGEVGEGVW